MKFIASLFVFVTVAACGSDFDPASRVTGFRILATRADQPYARPGETVVLDTLAVDGLGRPFALAWTQCTRPRATTATGCLDAIDAPLVQGPDLARHEVRIPDDILAGVPDDAITGVTVGVVQAICPGTVAMDPTAPLRLRCDEDGAALPADAYDVGVKRVFVRPAERNANPAIEAVTLDGAPWPADLIPTVDACADGTTNRFDRCDAPALAIGVVPSATSAEQGVDDLGRPFGESLLAQFYATEGLFEYEVRDATAATTRFRARAGARGERLTLWFVVRDDRGGVDWTSRQVDVR